MGTVASLLILRGVTKKFLECVFYGTYHMVSENKEVHLEETKIFLVGGFSFAGVLPEVTKNPFTANPI